ncbi:MAG TPA: metallophosphoesterase family protein [Gemmataceae bacterium]|nr:metallophosphoesterase family protein [Gemmataceae bacterium]
MRYLAVGDIHGCFQALAALAAFVPFQPEDVVITLGDYVNRGPNSCAVLDWLIAYQRRGKLVALRGNHELMMLQARESTEAFQRWMEYGGDATLASYSPFGDAGRLIDVPDAHWQFLEETRGWFETARHFFVHANAYPDCPLEEQPDFMLYWESFNDPPAHDSGKIMVCGHTPQKSGRPRNIGHAVCIDTCAHGEGWLTCLDIASGKYWQANQRGEMRCNWLEEEDAV